MADKALIGFLKVLVEINRDRQLISYRSDKRLAFAATAAASSNENSSTNFRVRMGFGLHSGWAIEGAVGSVQKVDATYLSPHVNMTARMEAACKQFKLAILMTQQFHEVCGGGTLLLTLYELPIYYVLVDIHTHTMLFLLNMTKIMTMEAQQYCRKVDVITVKGSSIPTPIYTYDTFQNQVFPQLRTPKYSNLKLEEVLNKQADEYDVSLWENDIDLIQLRRWSTNEFKEMYAQGLNAYLNGSWNESRVNLERANEMMAGNDVGGDGPSQIILNYMESRQWICPKDWKGYRSLTSK